MNAFLKELEEEVGMEAEAVEESPTYHFLKNEAGELIDSISTAASGCDQSFAVKRFLGNVLDHLSDEEKCSSFVAARALYKFLGEGV